MPVKRQVFPLGNIVTTQGAAAAFAKAGYTEAAGALRRHSTGDWGELDDEDKAANNNCLKTHKRLLSAYTLSTGTKIWIVTEADRSVTTFLLPEEY